MEINLEGVCRSLKKKERRHKMTTCRCKGWSYKKDFEFPTSRCACERIKYWAPVGGGRPTSIISDWLPDFFFFFEHFLLSVQRYSKTGEVKGLKDVKYSKREVGKMGTKGIKATEEIMEETGTSCEEKPKVKLEGGKYLQATKYSSAATCF